MDNKRKKDFLNQIYLGVLTIVLGIGTSMYGYNMIIGKIRGDIIVVIVLLTLCMSSVAACGVISFQNIKKYKNKK